MIRKAIVLDHDTGPGYYRGTPKTLWDKVIYDPSTPVVHGHPCPVCYEFKPCTMGCTLEPDLERSDGSPSGSHCVCDDCRRRGFTDRDIG